MLKGVTWFAQSAFRFRRGGKTVYIDPWHLPDGVRKADLILITHDHGDHLSPEDIDRISKKNTQVVVAASAASKLEGLKHPVVPGDERTVADVPIRVLPAYNRDTQFHPRDNGWVGYILELDGVTDYHTGDTDLIDEMQGVTADVVFLPVGGHYTMGPEEAAEAAKAIGPKLAVPIHWGDAVGSEAEAQAFAQHFEGNTQIMERGKEY